MAFGSARVPANGTGNLRLIILIQRGKNNMENWMKFVKLIVYFGYRKGKRPKPNYANNGGRGRILVRGSFNQ